MTGVMTSFGGIDDLAEPMHDPSMNLKRIDDCPPQPNPLGLDAHLVHCSETNVIVHMSLVPGQTVPVHSAPMDVVFVVLEGRGLALHGDTSKEIEATTIIESPRGSLHGFVNNGDGPLRVLAIKQMPTQGANS